jgi:N-acetylglucosaminyldiphosphoundecaprenol N-acetyl-beta-D-mannosaminyltransferase
MSSKPSTPTQSVIGTPITALSFDSQIDLMLNWASHHASKYICVANVHMVMEAYRKSDFASVLSAADMVTPDGMPLVWLMSRMGGYRQDRVAGMDILLGLFRNAPNKNISIFFLGSEQQTLDRIRDRLQQEFPAVRIAGMEPLPFRPLTPEEDAAVVQKINDSGAGIVLVCLGCPKQEIWMHQHRGQIQAVMIGLGGAFPVYAGDRKWAPIWVRKAGLEWFYRLIQEPRRLWKRYYSTIPPFIFLALKQLLTDRSKPQRSYQAS